MDDPPASPLPTPSASKGKAPAVPPMPPAPPTQVATPSHPYGTRGTKHREPEGLSDAAGGKGGVTPRKTDTQYAAGLPRVEVEIPSPPRPTQRPRTDEGGAVAFGDVSIQIID